MYYSATTAEVLPDVLDPETVARHLRLGPDEEDSGYLEMLVKAAMQWAEGEANQPLFARSYRVRLSDFSGGTIRGTALGEDVQVAYRTTAGDTLADLAPAGYQLSGNTLCFLRAGLPNLSVFGVELTYTVGYTQESLPDDLKLAILAHVGVSYEQRANPVAERYTLADKLLAPYKLYNC